jgi:hypothetical protein
MKRRHALIVAIAIALAAIAGGFAALRTTQLGASATTGGRVSTTQLAKQNHALDRAERTLLAELRKKPPTVPPLPAAAATPTAAPAVAAAAAPPRTVVYRRPPAIVHVIHRHGGQEHEAEGHDGGGDGGFDD